MKLSISASALAVLASLVQAAPANDGSDGCSQLAQSMPEQLSNLTVYASQSYPDDTTFVDPFGFDTPNVTSGVAAFCRFGGIVKTSNKSEFYFEVWMPPADIWSNRMVMTGNGGDSGALYYDAMSLLVTKYNVTAVSTNTGHFGDGGNGSFALNNPESQIDFGYRAVHLTTVYAKAVLKEYYGKSQDKSYWYGCSSGGKQGQKEIQMFPDDYDGALTGAPAQFWSRLNGFTQHINMVNAINSTGYISPAVFPLINAEVISQCDTLDGVADQVINNPTICSPDIKKFGCTGLSKSSAFNSSNCLNSAQLTTLGNIYTNYTYTTGSRDGQLLFPTFEPGSEYLWAASVNGRPYGPAPSYFLYQVQNVTTVQLPFDFPELNVTDTQLQQLVYESLHTDPGRTNADSPPTEFMKKGGKWIQYQGWADWLIPSRSSLVYRQEILDSGVSPEELDKSSRFYMVPGLGHCSGGPGAINFGSGSQSLSPVGSGQALKDDASHDMVLALFNWVEHDQAPEEIIAAAYVNDTRSLGVSFTRPLCNYPREAVYKGKGADETQASSFYCQ